MTSINVTQPSPPPGMSPAVWEKIWNDHLRHQEAWRKIREQKVAHEAPWFSLTAKDPCRGDCPHCWTTPVYLTEDGEPALDRYISPTWARHYRPL